MIPLHVVLVTDDPGLVAGMSTALSEHAGIAEVEAIAGAAAWPDSRDRPDLVIFDSKSSRTPDTSGRLSADRFPRSLIIRLRADAENSAGVEVESHLLLDDQGFLLREDLDEVAPVVVALAAYLAAA